MHFTQYDSTKHNISLEKREKIRNTIHQQVFNEDVDLDKMVRGDETFIFNPVIMVDNFFYKDNKYYILYDPNTEGIYTISKSVDSANVDDEVYQMAEKIAESKMKVLFEEIGEFNKSNNNGEANDSQSA